MFILPIRGTYLGKHAPIWVIRTGDLVFESADRALKYNSLKHMLSPNAGKTIKTLSPVKKGKVDHIQANYDSFRLSITKIGLQYF